MREPLKKSILLHIAVFAVMIVDIPFWHRDMNLSQVPIIVDLNDVKIAEMTNLPPKAKLGKEDKQASTIKRKDEKNYTTPEPENKPAPPAAKDKPQPKEAPAKAEETPQPPKRDFLEAPQPKKPTPKKTEKRKPVPVPQAKPKPKPESAPKKEEKKPEAKKDPKLANPLRSLLASVDALEKNIGETDQEATIKEGSDVNNMGIEGGTGGSYFSELSISETDAIAGRLRGCWNLDPGARGIEDMIIEIRAYLNQDGTVRKADILDVSRYASDAHFRSVADSARRAVFICEPAYQILAEKYADKYDMWKTMRLRFNPMDASVQ